MSKMLHEYFFDMQLFKNSEFGWVKTSKYLQLNINGCYMLCLNENNPFYWRDELLSFILEFRQNLKKNKRYFWSKIVFLSKKIQSLVFCFK